MKTFKDEVATLSRLRHKNIVALVGVCTQPTKLAIITEWVPRGALRDVLLDRTIDIKFSHVLKMAMDVAEGMVYLHSKNIIHRDLKSHNLLVDESWTVKVADFGYAKALPVDESMATTEVGTSGWVAPEVLRTMGTGYSHSVDVFRYQLLRFTH
jgi:serine/threonine protein kinase